MRRIRIMPVSSLWQFFAYATLHVLILSALLAPVASGQMVLDGTTPVQRKPEPPATPHFVAAGGSSNQIHPGLPLEVTIRDLNPASAALGDRLTVTILLRNAGKVPIDLPCSHDFTRVFKPGNSNLRTLSAAAVFDFGGSPISLLAATFAGSPSVPGSMCNLAPEASLMILGRIGAYGDARLEDARQHNTTLTVRMRVTELYYAGDEDHVVNNSLPSISLNSVPVFWHAPKEP